MTVIQLKTASVKEIVFRNNFKRLQNILEVKNTKPNELERVEHYPIVVEIKGNVLRNPDVKSPHYELKLSELEKEYNI